MALTCCSEDSKVKPCLLAFTHRHHNFRILTRRIRITLPPRHDQVRVRESRSGPRAASHDGRGRYDTAATIDPPPWCHNDSADSDNPSLMFNAEGTNTGQCAATDQCLCYGTSEPQPDPIPMGAIIQEPTNAIAMDSLNIPE